MKHATKDMAVTAKGLLEKQFSPVPSWIKSIDVDYDDHGYYVTTKIKSRQEYTASNVKLPSTIEVNGFKFKNCILVLG